MHLQRGTSRVRARVTDRFDAWALRDHCRDRVLAAIAEAGIRGLEMPAVGAEPHRIVVSSADVGAVDAALRHLPPADDVHAIDLGRWLGRIRPVATMPELRPGSVVRLYLPQVSLTGRPLPTEVLGVDLEVWTELDAPSPSPDGGEHAFGTLRSPRANQRARFLPPGGLQAPPAAVRAVPLEQVNFPVDAVYTWVDSSDPAWQAEFARADSHGADDVQATSRSPSRFASRDELRYSLRSLVAYASWIRRIHIVTNGQVPPWLDTTDPRIHVVSHVEIFPDPADLPTFNSHAIEACLHRIPGLSDHYLYFNDDVFLARPLRPEHFFSASGLIRYFPSLIPIDDSDTSDADLPVVSAFKNGRAVIERRFARRPLTRPRHTPHPQHRQVIEEIETAEPALLARTRRSRFRSVEDISLAAQLQSYWAAATGRAVAMDVAYEFLDIWGPDVDARIDRLLTRDDVDFYCLNETNSDPDQASIADDRVNRVLTTLLPFVSPFEKDGHGATSR
ncbi:hypothetical protein BJY20_001380 [Janibacter cremeus]|uniref:Sugar phosphotransferase n=1 Tax=Janibacter cremeus TaxID=1285192 RepID=A0A852VQE4_9MICO|nr:hypothetical protein [Janibacter cremeus]